MDFLRAIFGILVIIGIAILLGKTQSSKHPATTVYSFLFSIVALLLLRFFL